MLAKDCALAMAMLKRVAGPARASSAAPGAAAPTLPRDYLKTCAGLQFVVVQTGGLGLSGARGRALTIAKLGKRNGVTVWSAPAFTTCHAAGLGLTLGYDVVRSVVVLGTPAAVADAARAGPRLGLELDVVAGRERDVVQSVEAGCPTVPYSVAGGAMLDLSLKGGATLPATRKNEAAYGRGATPASILAGGVDRPAEFEPLYEMLSALAREYEEVDVNPKPAVAAAAKA